MLRLSRGVLYSNEKHDMSDDYEFLATINGVYEEMLIKCSFM